MVPVAGQKRFSRMLIPGNGVTPTSPAVWIFLHEGLGCPAMWHDFPAQVVAASGIPGLIYDRLSYGRSAARRVPRGKDCLHIEAQTRLPPLLAYFEIEAALHFGHSDGGTIALLHAARFPQQAAAFVAEAAHVFVEPVTRDGIRAALRGYKANRMEAKLARYHGAKARDFSSTGPTSGWTTRSRTGTSKRI